MAVYARLLDSPAIYTGQAWIEPRALKTTAVILHLAYRGNWVRREELTYLFWAEQPDKSARRNLRQLLSRIKQMDYTHALEAENERLRWAVETDVQDFHAAVAARHWSKAAHLYKGELLKGFSLHTAPEFESWLAFEREALHRIWRDAVTAFVAVLEAEGRHAQAAELLARLTTVDPLDEIALRRHLRALYRSGERTAALQSFAAFEKTLRKELDQEPDDLTLQLIEAIRHGEPLRVEAEGPTAAVALSGPAAKHRHNLTPQATKFIGRNREKAAITEQLQDPRCRLLTLTGPGGIGKTRLAIEVARAQADTFSDGVWFVPLESVSAPELMVSAIADHLNFDFFGFSEPRAQLLAYLEHKTLLLVLDNFEQLVDAVDLLADILRTAPDVKLLTTSRVRLNLQAEWIFDLEGLAVPEGNPEEDPRTYDAVRLFEQVATKARADFELDSNLQDVIRICEWGGGMPLAIELAAGWSRVLSLPQIIHELSKDLDFLESTARDMPTRHQSIRAAFDGSWTLLTQRKKAALRRLSCFHGGFLKGAAEAVAGVSLPDLLVLVDRSLLRVTLSGRFEHHPLVLQLTQEKAAALPDERAEVEERFSAYYADFLQVRKEGLRGLQAQNVKAEIESELANVLEAWRWMAEHAREDLLDKSLPCLRTYCIRHSRYQQGKDLFRTAQKKLGEESLVRGRLLQVEAMMDFFLRSYDSHLHEEAESKWRQSLAIFRRHGSMRDIVDALMSLSFSLLYRGERDRDELTHLLEEGLAFCRDIDDAKGTSWMLNTSSYAATDAHEAQRAVQEAVQIARLGGHTWDLATYLGTLASLLLYRAGDFARAKTAALESIDLFRKLYDLHDLQWALMLAGEIELSLGNEAGAEAFFTELLAASEDLHQVAETKAKALALIGLGQVAFARSNLSTAKALSEESLSLSSSANLQIIEARGLELRSHVAEGERKLEEATELSHNSLRLLPSPTSLVDLTELSVKIACLDRLGDIALANGDAQAAARRFHQALALASERGFIPAALGVLVGVARLLASWGESVEAANVLALIAEHPAGRQAVKAEARHALADIERELRSSSRIVAKERREVDDIDSVIQELLPRLSQDAG